jgi:hypothetical protein
MGSGKTFTGALFLANFLPPYRHVVIGPRNTNAEWTNTIKKVHVLETFTFVPLEKKTLVELGDPSNCIVIVDEAHLLVDILTNETIPKGQRVNIVKWFNKCKKIMLMTGTPFTSAPRDIAYLINIAAGKQTIPTNNAAFEKKYFKIDKKKAVLSGWLYPTAKPALELTDTLAQNYVVWLSLCFGMAGVLAYILELDSKKSVGQQIVNYPLVFLRNSVPSGWRELTVIKQIFDIFDTYVTKFEDKKWPHGEHLWLQRFSMNPAQTLFTAVHIIIDNADKFIGKDLLFNDVANVHQWKTYDDYKRHSVNQNVSQEYSYIMFKGLHAYAQIYNLINEHVSFPDITDTIMKAISKIAFVLSKISTKKAVITMCIISYIHRTLSEINSFYVLNNDAIAKDIAPYMSIYNPFLDNSDPVMQSHFPIEKQQVKKIKLTKKQMYIMYKVMLNKLSEKNVLEMGLVESVGDLPLYRGDRDPNFYENIGRIVSNLGDAPKFEQIFKMHRKNKRPTLIYSNFPGVLKKFMLAAEKEFRCEILPTDPSDYAKKQQLIKSAVDGTIDFLGLPHFATEGTDVPGMRVFHILEPCLDIVRFKQLRARVIRYQHDIVQRYEVFIYTWVARFPFFTFQPFYKSWSKFGIYQLPHLFKKNLETSSPDQLVLEQLRTANRIFDDVQRHVMELTKNNTHTEPLTCCVYNPNEPCTNQRCQDTYQIP